jgi:hypothetical protein
MVIARAVCQFILVVLSSTLRNKGSSGGFHQHVFRTPKGFLEGFSQSMKNPQRFSGKPKRVFGQKPFPRVFQKTLNGFSVIKNH